jgi:hypothetical protein
MNWQQITQQAELYRRDKVIYPRRWFNEGKSLLATLYPSACKVNTTEYVDADKKTIYSLPADFRYLRRVAFSSRLGKGIREFSLDPLTRTIMFDLDTSYTITYLSETADVIGAVSEVPEIHSAFHYVLAKYIAAKELEYIRDTRHQVLLAEFYRDATVADNSIRRGQVGMRNIKGGLFR